MKRFACAIAVALGCMSVSSVSAEPVSAIALFLFQNRAAIGDAKKQMTKAGQVDSAKLTESFADMSRQILTCYHKTATYQFADPIPGTFARQGQYGATDSFIIRINYEGKYTKSRFVMQVAVLAKQNAIRTVVLNDNNAIPWARDCELENWKSS